MSEHATVQRDGYEVPLIGVPKDAVEETCEGCGKPVRIDQIAFDGNGLARCPKCRSKK